MTYGSTQGNFSGLMSTSPPLEAPNQASETSEQASETSNQASQTPNQASQTSKQASQTLNQASQTSYQDHHLCGAGSPHVTNDHRHQRNQSRGHHQ